MFLVTQKKKNRTRNISFTKNAEKFDLKALTKKFKFQSINNIYI